MANRRNFLTCSAAGLALLAARPGAAAPQALPPSVRGKALALTTWNDGLAANQGAWRRAGQGYSGLLYRGE